MRAKLWSVPTIANNDCTGAALQLAIVCNENPSRSALVERALRQDWAGRAFHVTSALSSADLIFVLEEKQRLEVLLRLARFTGRVYRLGHWRETDIPDPLREPGCSSAACLQLIRACLGDWAAHLEAAGLLPAPTTHSQGVLDNGYRDAV